MKIGDLAKAAQCTVETIRYYERERLLPKPDRTGNNYRLYGPKHLKRLQFIRNCRAFDMSQEEVRALLRAIERPASNCGKVSSLLDEHIFHVEARIGELRKLKAQLATLRKECHTKHQVRDCGIVQGLSTMRLRGRKGSSNHLC
jgi:Cd(II)/Pb(II)-responsive transcriptional regulator